MTGITPLTAQQDPNQVNINDGHARIDVPSLSIPAAPRLKFDLIQNAMPFLIARINGTPAGDSQSSVAVHYGGSESESFTCTENACTNNKANGSRIDYGEGTGSSYGFILSPSGAHYTFDKLEYDNGASQDHQVYYYASSVAYPDGETISYTYQSAGTGQGSRAMNRLTKLSSNLGYFLTFTYQGSDSTAIPWRTLATATLYKTSDPNTALAQVTYAANGNITDSLGRVYNCSGCQNIVGAFVELPSGTMTLPGESSAEETISSYAAVPNNYGYPQLVNSVVRDGVVWSYSYANPRLLAQGAGTNNPGYGYDNVVVIGPAGYHEIYNINVNAMTPNLVASVVDGLNHMTGYVYDGNFRLTRITYPEGNYVQIGYDSYGNVVSKVSTPKSGSGLSTITETSAIDTTACGQTPVLCYRIKSHIDGLSHETDYAYDSMGRLIQRTDPADASGVRRATYLTYGTAAGSSFQGPTVVRVCGLTTTCGTNAEIRTEYDYWGQTALPSAKREIDAASGTTLTTTYSYDNAGHLLIEDGPLAGTGDATYTKYDGIGRKTMEIGPANNNGVRVAHRYTYRPADDKPPLVETGTVTDPIPASPTFTVTSQLASSYDAHRNDIRDMVSSGGTQLTITDHSFDDRGQRICDTVRMSLGSPPTDACTLSSNPFVPDRITRNSYDAAGQLTTVTKAYGTSLQKNDTSNSYTPNGKLARTWWRDPMYAAALAAWDAGKILPRPSAGP